MRRALTNPRMGAERMGAVNHGWVQALELPWMNAVVTARGLAGLYGVLANGGRHDGGELVSAHAIERVQPRQSWTERDRILQKPVGFSQGFLKDETHLFSPNTQAFGHAGAGGALGFADPSTGMGFGYVMNRMDYRLRSPRAVLLAQEAYRCLEALRRAA